MGRPQKGNVRLHGKSGRWEASVLAKAGSSERVYEYFDSEADARAWCEAALKLSDRSALTGSAERDRTAVAQPVSWFKAICEDFFLHNYVIEQRSGVGGEVSVRGYLDNHLLPFFAHRWQTADDVCVEDIRAFFQMLSGRSDADGNNLVGTDKARHAKGYKVSTQSNIRGALVQVLDHAMAKRELPHAINPARTVSPVEPLRGAKPVRRTNNGTGTTASFAQCRTIATQLHILWQLAMWLQRVCGLRGGEVFGIRVGDVRSFGGYGWCRIEAQGGSQISERDEIGRIKPATHRTEDVKTKQSMRLVVIPPSLMKLIDVVIQALHTRPDGTIDVDSPLVPGIKKLGTGHGAYRSAVKQAGLDEDYENWMIPHQMRHAMISDLATSSLTEAEQRLYVGHLAGGDVHARTYVHQVPNLQRLAKAADFMEEQIAGSIGTLMVPTDLFPFFQHDHPYRNRVVHAKMVLQEHGLFGVDQDRLSSVEVGEMIGRSEQVVRRLMESGAIVASKVRGADKVLRWAARRSDVEAYLATYDGKWTIDDIAIEVGCDYHPVRNMLLRLGVHGDKDPNGANLLYDDDAVTKVRAELGRIAALHERSMLVSEAAVVLRRTSVSSLKAWIDNGTLELDPETDSSGYKFVTRESVARKAREDAARTRRSGIPGRATRQVAA